MSATSSSKRAAANSRGSASRSTMPVAAWAGAMRGVRVRINNVARLQIYREPERKGEKKSEKIGTGGNAASSGRENSGRGKLPRLRRDRVVLAGVQADRVVRRDVEQGLPVAHPLAPAEVQDRRGLPRLLRRRDILHVAAGDGVELHRDGDQGRQPAGRLVPDQGE